MRPLLPAVVIFANTGILRVYPNLRSRQTERLDDFLSHSWETPRWKKTLALYFVYSGRAAVLASTIFSSLFTVDKREREKNV